MRRLTLLLFLMMVAAFRWSIGSAEASTTTEQNDAVLPRTHITLEAVNTGFEDTAVAASISRDRHSLDYARAAVGSDWCRSTLNQHDPLPVESTSGIRVGRDRRRQNDRKSLSSLGSGLIGRDEPICNLA